VSALYSGVRHARQAGSGVARMAHLGH
jgi:hypothetical protein